MATTLVFSAAPADAASVASTAKATQQTRKPARKPTWNVPRHWHKGFGFLPGFSPAERRERAVDRWREERRGPYYIYGGPGYWSSFSRPGFYRGRYNGGGFGPCWTRTPIGAVWNCG
jgi:hypothetical protein